MRSGDLLKVALCAAGAQLLVATVTQGAPFGDSNWISLGGVNGTAPSVTAMVVDHSGNLYVGGRFTTAGDTAATNIARWNGSTWSPLGSGLNGTVRALAMSGDTLYAGGDFTAAGSTSATNIARWNGSNWSPLGSGLNGGVDALAVWGGNLYAGGVFTMSGGTTAIYVAQWNGSSWSGLNWHDGSVYTLAVLNNTLYAGSLGGVARWSGSSWSWLPGMIHNPIPNFSIPGTVHALAVSSNTLYAGGWFTAAGGNAATYIAQWNGSSWLPLGSGMNSPVTALAAGDGTLYAGGWFTNAGGSTANYIAQWNGSNWSPLGSGMNTNVWALAVSGSVLYAGGDFTTAGGKVSAHTAEAVLISPEMRSGLVRNPDGSITVRCFTATNCLSRLYAATNVTSLVLWRPLYTNATGGLWQFTDTNTSGNGSKFYRLSTP